MFFRTYYIQLLRTLSFNGSTAKYGSHNYYAVAILPYAATHNREMPTKPSAGKTHVKSHGIRGPEF